MRFSTCAQRVSTLPSAFVHAMVEGILMSHRYTFHAHDLLSSLTMVFLGLIKAVKYECRVIRWRGLSTSLIELDVGVVIEEIWCTRRRLQSTRLESFRFGLCDSNTFVFVLIFQWRHMSSAAFCKLLPFWVLYSARCTCIRSSPLEIDTLAIACYIVFAISLFVHPHDASTTLV